MAAADFLQNVVSINVQLMEEEKVCFTVLLIGAPCKLWSLRD